MPTIRRGHVDLNRGVFYRRAIGRDETKKRQPPVRLPFGGFEIAPGAAAAVLGRTETGAIDEARLDAARRLYAVEGPLN
jgi:hypothetical protein